MARLVYGMMQSLDGYVSGPEGSPGIGAPDDVLFQHFTDWTQQVSGCLYGRVIFELMRYWDEDRPEYSDTEREFSLALRSKPKWVVSRTLKAVGPNATLVVGNPLEFVRRLKDEVEGDIDVGGPTLAGYLGEAGLIDEYRLYLRPVVLGGGTPFFTGVPPKLRLQGVERVGSEAVCVTYVS